MGNLRRIYFISLMKGPVLLFKISPFFLVPCLEANVLEWIISDFFAFKLTLSFTTTALSNLDIITIKR